MKYGQIFYFYAFHLSLYHLCKQLIQCQIYRSFYAPFIFLALEHFVNDIGVTVTKEHDQRLKTFHTGNLLCFR